MTFSLRTALGLLVASAGAVALAGCGSSGGPTGAATSASARPNYSQLVKFSQCMRAAGVSNFPDPPPGGGGLEISPSSGVNPRAPAFQAAQKKCGKLLPGKFGPGKPTKAQFQRALAFAKCVRAHGLRTFPDPLSTPPTGGGPVINLQGMIFVPGQGFDPRSPAFRRAASACGVRPPTGKLGP